MLKQRNDNGVIPVAAAIIIGAGEILVARRRRGLHLEGHWEFPGGKLEPGETPEQCLVRELREELGIDCRIEGFLGESIYCYSKKTVQLLGYVGTMCNIGIFRLEDHDEVRWVPADNRLLSLNWAPADIPLVGKAIDHLLAHKPSAVYERGKMSV